MVVFFLLWMVAFTLLKVLPALTRKPEVILLKGQLAKDIAGWGLVCGVLGGLDSLFFTEEHRIVLMLGFLFPIGILLAATVSDFYWISRRSQSLESTQGRRRLSDHLDWREKSP